MSTSVIRPNQYQSFLEKFHLDSPQSLAPFFVVHKHNTVESLRVRVHRAAHYVRTGIWISEGPIFKWAKTHPRQKISALLDGRPIQRKVVRYEQKMAVPQQSFLTRCVEAVKFFGQYIRHPGTIGAVLPSSNSLAKQIVSEIAKDPALPPRRILEIGPGTGVFTDKIIKRMNPGDILHLVEFDKGLARGLRERYQQNPNVKVFCRSILDYKVPENERYDHVVSGLPLNSFPAAMVTRIFEKYRELPREGGTLSYFDYRFLPSIKRVALGKRAREEFDRILVQKANFYASYGVRKETVVVNAPPARVLHHKLTEAAAS